MSSAFWGWRIVTGAFVVLFVAYGAQYSFGVFFAALLDEFHWSRAGLSGVFALYAFLYAVVGFPAGRLTDRWGPRVVITLGGVFLGGALAAMALVHALWEPYLLYGVLGALGMGTAYVPCNSTVVKWFARRRGLAVGLASAGGSAGAFVLPPVAQLVVARAGWRAAYVLFGAVIFGALALVATVMRRDPESVGQWPDGEPPGHVVGDEAPAWPLPRAARTMTFWLLAAAFTATWIPVFIPLVHLVPFARDLGYSPLVGASAVSALGAAAIVGRLVMGSVSDRFGRKPTIAVAMLIQALAFAALAGVHDIGALYTASVAFGVSYGAVSTLFPAIVGDFFGREQAGTLVGVLFAISGSMGAWGPLAAGALYDATGGYRLAFVLAAATNVTAAGILALCRPPVPALARPAVASE